MIEKQIAELKDEIKSKLNELMNLYRENKCYQQFIKDKALIDEYSKYKDEFYRNREWRNEEK